MYSFSRGEVFSETKKEFATLVEGYGWEINFVRGSEMQPKIEAWAEELAPVFQEILNAN